MTILAEDTRSANLLRRYVQRALDLNHRQVYQVISPSGKGDAKHWVVGRYSQEVAELRRKHHRVALLVHLDADVETVKRRSEQLAEALKVAELDERTDSERIVHAIPRRHTETWLCALTGIEVDEEMDCKRLRMPANPDQVVLAAALALYQCTRRNALAPILPSLESAVLELRRLEVE